MASLFEIAEQVTSLDEMLEHLGGELTPELEAELAKVETEIANKTESYIAVMEIATQRAEHWKALEKKCNASRKACETTHKRLKDVVIMVMLKLGKMQIVGKNRGFKLRACAQSFQITDEALIPEKYKSEKQIITLEIDKAAIKQDLINGIAVPGCRLEGGQSLGVINA